MNRSPSLLYEVLRAAGWYRRVFAALAAAAAVYFGLSALSPASPRTVAVLAAARDLPGGSAPVTADLRTVHLPPRTVPAGALRPGSDLASRVLAVPVRSGEPLTDVRFVTPDLVRRSGHRSGQGSADPEAPASAEVPVGYPMRIGDAEVVALLRVGDRIDVLAASSTGSSGAERVATAVPIIALPAPSRASGPAGGQGALVMISAPSSTVARIAQAAVNSRLFVALTGTPP